MRPVSRVAKIIGPPGTGKTSYLLRQVERAAKKYGADRIGAVSYTKAATEEIRSRASQGSGVALDAIPNIRTIHSHCFKMLELKMDQVADKYIKDFNSSFPQFAIPVSGEEHNEDEPTTDVNDWSIRDNKKRYNLSQQWRKRMIPIGAWPDQSVAAWYKQWARWMYIEGLIDFTGMIERAVERELCPDIAVLFVDECQDLAPLEIELMKIWSEKTEGTVYIGDSDQCIYRWSGAVPEAFIGLKHEFLTVLKKSFRVPRAVCEYAVKIIAQAVDREKVVWEPTEVPGSVSASVAPDLSLPGTHMILARCNYMLVEWRKWLIRENVAWSNPYKDDLALNPCDTKIWRAARTYLRLKAGHEVPASDIKNMAACMSARAGWFEKGAKTFISDKWAIKRGDKVDIFEAASLGFSKRFLEMKEDYKNVLSISGVTGDLLSVLPEDKILEKPCVILGTIHSVKGGEASHVWLDSRTTGQIVRASLSDETVLYDEARVAYVAATRARESFTIIRKHGLQNKVLP